MNDQAAERGTIPARHGVAISLGRGSELVLINTHGTQVLDTWAFSCATTPASTCRWSTPARA